MAKRHKKKGHHKTHKKYGKIGAPKSAKRRRWMKKLRRKL